MPFEHSELLKIILCICYISFCFLAMTVPGSGVPAKEEVDAELEALSGAM